MGHIAATDMLANTDRRTAMRWHLQSNHYPPHPDFMVDIALQAVDLVAAECDEDERIDLPGGALYGPAGVKPRPWATPHEIVRSMHLEPWVEAAIEEDQA